MLSHNVCHSFNQYDVIHNLINSISNEVNIDHRNDEEINYKEKSNQVSNKEEFSLENMKFWEVWTTKKPSTNLSPNFESPFWPQPPAIWGKTRMGQTSKVEESKPIRPAQSSTVEDSSLLNNDLHKAPIVTNLDNIVNVLRPVVYDSKRSEVKRDLFEKKDYQNLGNVWIESVSPEVMGEVTQSQNYPLNYKNIYNSESETFDHSNNNNKMIEKRNLKKIVIEQKDNNNIDEVVYKKKKKKPTIVIEEEYVDPSDDELYQILKNNESPASKQVIIEEDYEDEQEIPKKKPLVRYEKNEKLKVKRKPRKMVIIEKDELLDDNSDDVHNDSEDESYAKETPKTTIEPINERRKYRKTLRAEASDETPKKDVLNEKFDSFHDSSAYYYNENDENIFGDEKAWGSASPHTRVKAGTNTKRLLNPFSVLQRLRPKIKPYEIQPNRMIPGGTFHMRFYMNGQQREEEQNDDYDY